MFPEIDELRARVVNLEKKIALLEQSGTAWNGQSLSAGFRHGVRKRSETELFGIPLWEIAMGPDIARGETRGHARAIFAMGDIATGVFAFGGLARGLFSFGGIALGAFTFGGISLGLLVALGGMALGLGFSVGGLAVGSVAIGGAAFGVFSVGGLAVGLHRIGPPL